MITKRTVWRVYAHLCKRHSNFRKANTYMDNNAYMNKLAG